MPCGVPLCVDLCPAPGLSCRELARTPDACVRGPRVVETEWTALVMLRRPLGHPGFVFSSEKGRAGRVLSCSSAEAE